MAKAKLLPQLDRDAPNEKNARIIIQARLDELYSWDACVDDPDRVQDLHHLRIAAKRLRYTLELFETVLPAENVSLRNELAHIQEELGTVHDSDVMIALLEMSLGNQDGTSSCKQTISETCQGWRQEEMNFSPALLSHLLDPAVAPSAQERQGLQMLLTCLYQERQEQFVVFREHWRRLKEQDFQHQFL